MNDLLPCQGCQRHIRPTELRCPFCARPSAARGGPLLAAALIGAASLTSCADKDKDKKEQEPTPVEATIDAAQVAQTSDAAATPGDANVQPALDAAAPDAAPAAQKKAKTKKRKRKKEPLQVKEKKLPADRLPPPMPYGAPPARQRLV